MGIEDDIKHILVVEGRMLGKEDPSVGVLRGALVVIRAQKFEIKKLQVKIKNLQEEEELVDRYHTIIGDQLNIIRELKTFRGFIKNLFKGGRQ